MKNEPELDAFLEGWEETPENVKTVFLQVKECLLNKEGVTFEFVARPGVTHSLRAVHAAQRKRKLFVIIDVIENDPRWLSICFYSDMITDPEDRGIFVPNGLLEEDAVCFDIEEYDENYIRYVSARFDEACRTASEG
jgi:hypothetical protein